MADRGPQPGEAGRDGASRRARSGLRGADPGLWGKTLGQHRSEQDLGLAGGMVDALAGRNPDLAGIATEGRWVRHPREEGRAESFRGLLG